MTIPPRQLVAPLVAVLTALVVGCSEQQQAPIIPTFDTPQLQQGRSTWMQVCRNCHLRGVVGAPAIDDVAAWTARIDSGREQLYRSAINGIGDASGWRMPPRGGNDALSDTEVRQAVDFMLAAVQQGRESKP